MNDYDSFVCVLVAMNPDNTDNGCCTGTWNCWKYFGNTFGSSAASGGLYTNRAAAAQD